jgi:hypothetical protein
MKLVSCFIKGMGLKRSDSLKKGGIKGKKGTKEPQ